MSTIIICFTMTIAGSIPVSGGHFRQGNDSILLDDLKCNGTEQTLLNCTYSQTHNCDHSEDAGVRCEGKVKLPDSSSGIMLLRNFCLSISHLFPW